MTKPRGTMPEALKRAPLWLLAHDIDPEDPALDATDPEQDPPEDGYSTDAAGTFTDE